MFIAGKIAPNRFPKCGVPVLCTPVSILAIGFSVCTNVACQIHFPTTTFSFYSKIRVYFIALTYFCAPMKYLFSPLRLLYKLYVGVIFLITGLLFYPFLFFMIRGERKYKNALLLKRLWSKMICILILIRVKIEFEEEFPKNQPYIVCANHASYFDIILMFLILPDDFAFLGKAEVLKWPLVNIFFKRGIDIPVFRGSVKRAKECLDLSDAAIKQGRSIAIFPEGVMEINSNKLKRFKNGAFKLAMGNNTPVVPVTFLNNWKLFSDHVDLLGAGSPGIARVKIHKAIQPNTKYYKDLVSLRDHTYSIIENTLVEYENRRPNS